MKPTLQSLARAKWKGPHFVSFPLKQARENNTPISTKARSCTILPAYVGLKFLVHNGITYTAVNVRQEMVGHRLGEFSSTRKPFHFKQSKNR